VLAVQAVDALGRGPDVAVIERGLGAAERDGVDPRLLVRQPAEAARIRFPVRNVQAASRRD
jgi:hypothetical protein